VVVFFIAYNVVGYGKIFNELNKLKQ